MNADGLLGLRFAPTRRPSASIPHGGENFAALPQDVDGRVPFPRDVLDDLRMAPLAVHLRDARATLLVRERPQARTGERAPIQHHEDRCEIEVRLREPIILQLRHVPIDELPLRRALDEERQVEPQPIPDRDEVPIRLEDPLVEDHVNELFLPPLPFRNDLEGPRRCEVVRQGLVLGRHDPVLLWVVPGRLDVEVVEGQAKAVRLDERPEGA